MALLTPFSEEAQNGLYASLAEASDVYDQGVINAVSLGVLVIALAIGIGHQVAHSVRSPLTRILSTLESLTQGDMTQRIEIRYNNEFSRVSGHINSLADNLHDILKKLNGASDNLTNTASTNQQTSSQAQLQLSQQREKTASVATA